MEMYTTLQAAKTENCQVSSDTTGVPLHFDVFANSVYKYSMWKSELQVSQNDLGAYQKGLFYISTCERALSDFDKDREKCLALGDHDCLGQLLWGMCSSTPTLWSLTDAVIFLFFGLSCQVTRS
jgi:hypothetical protein